MSPQSPAVEAIQLDSLAAWRIRRGDAELLLAQQGAQILSYRRGTQPPLIWLSEQAAYQRGQSVRGGVPVCWPWFGDMTRNPPAVQAMVSGEAPFHGLVRTLDWQLDTVETLDTGVRVSLSLPAGTTLPGWQGTVRPRLQLTLGDDLLIELHNANTGRQPAAISQALHSYFPISDIRQVQLRGLDGCRYIETLEDWAERRQHGDLEFAGETDRIYLDVPQRLELLDQGWQRRLVLEVSGSRSAIVWNPWIDKAGRLSQFAADAWQRMLCIETANVWDDCLQLGPGESHCLSLRLSSQAL
ncbi:D-hexose-6-phosphate mutarotase [Pseudomonas sp. HAR-UPW-AIA-41]|uniref:D-hexose-6-phosphate mutarotase n=1 Tax=Pseudomonas sp. HAR-UPW-AIA-41 TaxID=1985301 RepID=UPI000BB36EA0|nr:D-hexose-6-phosphate mutarotase [Pseudomonas sp. HAR-UPW-AIA-41]PAV48253.1 D-hexose-6-phosphate mutarotase [Pseudomonas sp. HAR-UPW-AIA-41]